MPRRNRSRKGGAIINYDTDYVNLPEYPRYNSVVAIPLKTIFYNLDADHDADDFYVARHYGDPVMRKLAKKIEGGVST